MPINSWPPVEQNTMTLQNTSFWYAAFLNRPSSKKLPGTFVQKRTEVFIPEYFRIPPTQTQPTGVKPERNIRAMQQTLKKPLAKMVLSSLTINTSKIITVTVNS